MAVAHQLPEVVPAEPQKIEPDPQALPKVACVPGTTPRSLPLLRADCVGGPRPCPMVSCRHHLYTSEGEGDDLKLTYFSQMVEDGQRSLFAQGDLRASQMVAPRWKFFDGVPAHSMPPSCALDIADAGESSADEIGALLGIDPERVRQLIDSAYAKYREAVDQGSIDCVESTEEKP